MRRRKFLLGLGAAAWPLSVRAQPDGRMRRIGILMPYTEGDREARSFISAFRQRLRELGWNESGNVRIDERWGAGKVEQIRTYAVELVDLDCDVILGVTTPAVAALHKATRTIPIVSEGAQNPVGSGFVASLSRPGGNITGFLSFEAIMGGKWLEILKELAPGVARVALVHNPKTHTGQYFPSIEAASSPLAVKPIRLPFGDASELERRIGDFAREPKGGLLVLPDASTVLHRRLIIMLAERHQLPAIYPLRMFVEGGGLAVYGTNRAAQYRKAAEYVDQILRGAKPAELPVQAATKYELVINLKAAKAVGLAVPSAMLTRADEIIE